MLENSNAVFISFAAVVIQNICQGVFEKEDNFHKNRRIVLLTNVAVCAINV